MIESFRHKGLRLFFEHGDGSKLPAEMLPRIRLILTALQAAQTIEGMDTRCSNCTRSKATCGAIGRLWYVPTGALFSGSKAARRATSILLTTTERGEACCL